MGVAKWTDLLSRLDDVSEFTLFEKCGLALLTSGTGSLQTFVAALDAVLDATR